VTAPTARAGWRSGWSRLAEAVFADIPVEDIDGLWQFLPLRVGKRELGTAILARKDGDRRRIYTARYVLTIRGKERGAFESHLEEVGSGPAETLDQMLLDVRRRLDEDDAPVPVDIATWVAAAADGQPHA
jgi:hypothetical protein